MKALVKTFFLVSIMVITSSCGNKPQENAGEPVQEESTNAILEREIDKIHMDAMEKMEEVQKIRRKLKTTLTDSVMNEAGKAAIEKSLATLDSADKLMMDWMHEFNPPADSADKEETRAYLEQEMEKIRIVKQAMLETIEEDGDSN